MNVSLQLVTRQGDPPKSTLLRWALRLKPVPVRVMAVTPLVLCFGSTLLTVGVAASE